MKNPKKSRLEIEKRLREIASELLSLNERPTITKKMTLEEKLSSYSTDWRNLYTEGCAEICLYAEKLYPAHSGEPSRAARHGVLLMKIAHYCFKNFQPESGDFINYLSHTIKTEFTRAERKESLDEMYGGIKNSASTVRIAKEFLDWSEQNGKNPKIQNVQKWYCTCFGVSIEKLQKALKTEFEISNTDEVYFSTNDKQLSLFDTLDSNYSDGEKHVADEDEVEKYLSEIDARFCYCQERTKAYLAALLTHRVLTELENTKIEKDKIEELLRNLSFACELESKRVAESFFGAGEFFTQEQVAAWFGRDKTDASRTLKNFEKKLAEKVSTMS